MTDDAQAIRAVLDRFRHEEPNKTERAERLARKIARDQTFRNAVARHLISTDPEAVRVPLKGTVS